MFNLKRFLDAQEYMYQIALNEIISGCKYDHWIWFIFPQYKGLGHSYMSQLYAICSIDEARAYLEDYTLGGRLREILRELLKHTDKSIDDILGPLDAMKLKSSMTLFDTISPNDIFNDVLEAFFESQRDAKTLSLMINQ